MKKMTIFIRKFGNSGLDTTLFLDKNNKKTEGQSVDFTIRQTYACIFEVEKLCGKCERFFRAIERFYLLDYEQNGWLRCRLRNG